MNDEEVMDQLKKSVRPSVVRNLENTPISTNHNPTDIVSKARELEKIVRLGIHKDPQKVIDDVYRKFGVIVHPNKNGEIVTIGGRPLFQGDIEYLKTTKYGFDHFIIYHALKYQDERKYLVIDNVCTQFDLHAQKEWQKIVRLCDTDNNIIAQLLGRERVLEGVQNKVVMPYEVVSLSSKYNLDLLHNEKQLLHAIVAEIFKANVGAPYTPLSHYISDPKYNPGNGTGVTSDGVPSSLDNVKSITPSQLRRKRAFLDRFFGR